MSETTRLYVIMPCYNEEECVVSSVTVINGYLQQLTEDGRVGKDSRILVVDDGSKDGSLELLKDLASRVHSLRILSLAQNRGHQTALYAGYSEAVGKCDLSITLDLDLQDDHTKIAEMVSAFDKGADIIYGIRKSRGNDSLFKAGSAKLYYWLQGKLGLDVLPDHADYRGLSNKALEMLIQYREFNPYIRGLVRTLGLDEAKVYYERKDRLAGKSKYPLSKMLKLARDGIYSFTAKPLKLATNLGILFVSAGFLYTLKVIYEKIIGITIQGWASLMVAMLLEGGVQLIVLGIVGEYIARMYTEIKGRPKYFIKYRSDEE